MFAGLRWPCGQAGAHSTRVMQALLKESPVTAEQIAFVGPDGQQLRMRTELACDPGRRRHAHRELGPILQSELCEDSREVGFHGR